MRPSRVILYALAVMHIERNHKVGQAEAIRRINQLLDDLVQREFPQGITVQNFTRNWSANVARFSFKAEKSFFGVTIAGVVRVDDELITLDLDLPGLVTTFVSEDEIRQVINQQLVDLFPG